MIDINPRYRLLATLAEGAMGTVYRVHDRLIGQDVALKRVRLAPETDANSEALRLALAHEFRTLAGLRHPHIISVLDYGFVGRRQPFFTMELLQGAQTLTAASQSLPQPEKVALLLQLLRALSYLHRRGILHREICKPNFV